MSKTYTRDEIVEIVNKGGNLVHNDPIGKNEQLSDVVSLVVSAIVHLMDTPGATLDDVMDMSYPDGAEVVRSWWDNWS